MPKFLTQEWLDTTREMAAGQPERPGASVRMNHVVSGGPDGEVTYFWVMENGRLEQAELGALDDAEVTLTVSYDDWAAVTRGELDLNAAFMQGRVKVTGNMAKLMSMLPLTTSPEYRELQERIREVTEL